MRKCVSKVSGSVLFCVYLILAAYQPVLADGNTDKVDNCVQCHTENEMLPEGFSANDIHMENGLGCVGCHGGDATTDDQDLAMSKAAGFRGVPDKKDIPAFCGRCHSDISFMRKYNPGIATDQRDQYFTSVHGQKLKKGDTKVAVCSSCHGSHNIFRVRDSRSSVYALNVPATCGRCHNDKEYMKSYNIPTDQLEKYAQSVHGKALLEKQDTGAPACNDCHGNHGAMPPGVNAIAYICGNCHVNNRDYFLNSRMGTAFAENEMHACEECHGNHLIEHPTDAMLGGENAVCLDCHEEGDAGHTVAVTMAGQLSQATALYDSAAVQQVAVRNVGMDDVDLGFMLQDAHQAIIHARTLIHTFDAAKTKEKTDISIKKSSEALQLAATEIAESRFRRLGFGFATVFITLLIIGLYLKIKQIDKETTA